jgi:hypothetical protein
MRWERYGNRRGLPRWAAALVSLLVGSVLIYSLVCLFLAVYLWFNPIVF